MGVSEGDAGSGGDTGWDALGLDPRLLRALTKKRYRAPTPVQARAIPLVLAGKDVVARAAEAMAMRKQKKSDGTDKSDSPSMSMKPDALEATKPAAEGVDEKDVVTLAADAMAMRKQKKSDGTDKGA